MVAEGLYELPKGLCSKRDDHTAHKYNSETLGVFWCTANQEDREPYRSERKRIKLFRSENIGHGKV